MKKLSFLLVLFFIIVAESAMAQSVRVNFIRFKKIEYSSYSSRWDNWPMTWTSSSAYALISSVYDQTYRVSVYSYDDKLIVTSVCTFDSEVSTQKRKSQNLPYLNCYTDTEGDQIWTNVVSLQSLLENVKSWEKPGAELYLWVFGSSPFAFVFQ